VAAFKILKRIKRRNGVSLTLKKKRFGKFSRRGAAKKYPDVGYFLKE